MWRGQVARGGGRHWEAVDPKTWQRRERWVLKASDRKIKPRKIRRSRNKQAQKVTRGVQKTKKPRQGFHEIARGCRAAATPGRGCSQARPENARQTNGPAKPTGPPNQRARQNAPNQAPQRGAVLRRLFHAAIPGFFRPSMARPHLLYSSAAPIHRHRRWEAGHDR